MNRSRFLILVIAIVGFCACTTITVTPDMVREVTAKQLSIEPSEIIFQGPACFAAVAPGAEYAKFTFGLYSQTKTDVVLFAYTSRTKTFTKVLSIPIKDVKNVAIETWGAFDHLKQMQLSTRDSSIAINFSNDADAMAGYVAETKPPFDALVAVGVQSGISYGRVLPIQVKNFVVPVYVPAR